jgi:hypothetical protein
MDSLGLRRVEGRRSARWARSASVGLLSVTTEGRGLLLGYWGEGFFGFTGFGGCF